MNGVIITIAQPSTPAELVRKARETFNSGQTIDVKFRRKQLKNLLKFVEENEEDIISALYKDLRKPRQEAEIMEVATVSKEIKHYLNHFEDWARPGKPTKSLIFTLDGVSVYKEPYGVVLIIGPWNYPFQLLMMPLIGAIAAGNCVILKPSDQSPYISQLFQDKLHNYLDQTCYQVLQGGVPETTAILQERFDYIFFTGGTQIGRIIYNAAQKHLTPVTLELGGKSPAFIDISADLEKTVRRILWGKCINAGQTCVAPDYILCTGEVQEKFISCAKKILVEFYGEDPKESPDFSRIITERHCERLIGLLAGLKIAIGGRFDLKERFIEPTVAVDVSPDHPIMGEEIFGPILPILVVQNVEEAINFINKGEKPLSLYIFTKKKNQKEKLLKCTSSGGVCVNDTILHITLDMLPFGGVGCSGIGGYHGRSTFDTFTHEKSVLTRDFMSVTEKILSVRYPPYSNRKISIMKLLLVELKRLPLAYLSHLVMFILGALLAGLIIYFCTK